MDTSAQPVLSTSRSKRHYRTAEERRRIVEETLAPGVSVATVARAHGVNANQVFHWRKLYQTGLLGKTSSTAAGEAGASCVRLLPVTVAADAECDQPVAMAASTPRGADRKAVVLPGAIELTLAKAQIRITGTVDAETLRVVLECLLG
jgi:transposase